MKKLDLAAISTESGCNYPAPFDRPCLGATWKRLGDASGLTQFGVNLSRLPPGVWSSQRHWLATRTSWSTCWRASWSSIDDGEEVLQDRGTASPSRPASRMATTWSNRSSREAVVLEVGTRDADRDRCVYPDIDMIAEPKVEPYLPPAKLSVNKPSTWLVGQAP